MIRKTFSLCLTMLLSCSLLSAQAPKALPMDPAVRYGHLDNGLTYYIVHNELPEHRAEFYIAQRVGSVLEEESQRGLAHFLEHMAFNGLKNFPGKSMLDYLQRHGVKFGTNVNAYTSIDETVYNISEVPTDPVAHPNIVDSCLLILHDWSGFISLEGDEIDNERGVIHEEWRSRNSPNLRLVQNHLLPKLMPGTRYAERMPIGLMSVVDSFKHEELRAYYHKWYRPDLQAIFVVGDVDVDAVEQKVRTLWQDIQTPADAAERVYFPVPDNDEPLVCVATDPEYTSNEFAVYFKRPKMPAEMHLSMAGYATDYVESTIASIINNRLREIAMKADAPFQAAAVRFSNYLYAKTTGAFAIDVQVKPGQLKEGVMAAMAVVRSVQEYGVTDDEISRRLADTESELETIYNERDKRKNASIINEIKRHFLANEAMPGIEVEWKMLFPQLKSLCNAATINRMCKGLITERNVALYFMGQQKEGNPVPTEAELLDIYSQSVAQPAVAYAEEKVAKQLVARLPKPGKVKKVAAGPFGSTVWTLSNGVKVVWKQTDYKKDAIMMSVSSEGGYEQYKDEPRVARQMMSFLYSMGGIGDYSPITLQKALAGKQASVSASIGANTERLSGSCTPKDIRTMFEMTYLRFTAPRQDQDIYQSSLARVRQNLKDEAGTPNRIIADSSAATFYKGQPDHLELTEAELDEIDYNHIFQLGKERFANAADFTFFLVGNINEDSLRVMCQQYLATLPASKHIEQYRNSSLPTPGSRENRFDIAMEQPKTRVVNRFNLYDQPWNLKDALMVEILGQVGRMTLTETIREQEGGVYSPSASASFGALSQYMTFSYSFTTGAEKLSHIEEVAYREISKLATSGGISQDAVQKVRDYMVKRYEDNLKENSYWISQIQNVYLYQLNRHDGYLDTLNSITTADLEAMMARLLKGDRVQFIANGINKE